MRPQIPAFALLALLPLEAGCDLEAFLDSQRYHEDFQYTHSLKRGGRLSVENFNGSIEILGWEKDSVQVSGTKNAATEADLKDMRIETTGDESAVRIRTIRPEGRRNMGAKYFIRVPREVELDRVVSSNGSIRVEDIAGNANLATSNGGVRVRKISGRLDVKTSNGGIEGEDLDSEATLRTSNGAIRIGHLSGALEAATSNGGISVRMVKASAGRPLRVRTSNGGIDLDMESTSGADVHATTSNAAITLRLPPSAAARINARTSHATVQSDFDVRAQSVREKNELVGDINGGGPNFELVTSNAAIRILRR